MKTRKMFRFGLANSEVFSEEAGFALLDSIKKYDWLTPLWDLTRVLIAMSLGQSIL